MFPTGPKIPLIALAIPEVISPRIVDKKLPTKLSTAHKGALTYLSIICNRSCFNIAINLETILLKTHSIVLVAFSVPAAKLGLKLGGSKSNSAVTCLLNQLTTNPRILAIKDFTKDDTRIVA